MNVVLEALHSQVTEPSARGAIHALDAVEAGATVVFEAGPEALWEAVAAGEVVVEGDDPTAARDRAAGEELTFGLRPAESDEEPEPERALAAARAARASDDVALELTDAQPRKHPENFLGETHEPVEGVQLVFAERMLAEPGLVETVMTENRDDPQVRAALKQYFEADTAFEAEREGEGAVSTETIEDVTDAFADMILTRDRATRDRLKQADIDPDNTVVVRGRAHRWFPEMLAAEESFRPVELTVPPDLYDREQMLDAFRDRADYDWGERLVLGEAADRIDDRLAPDETGPVRVAEAAREAAATRRAAGTAGAPTDDVLPDVSAYRTPADAEESATTDPAWSPDDVEPSPQPDAGAPPREADADRLSSAGPERLAADEFAVLDADGERTDALDIDGFEAAVEDGLAVAVTTDEGAAGLASVGASTAGDPDTPHAVAADLAERTGVSMGFVTEADDTPRLDRLVVVGADERARARLDVAADVRFGGVDIEHAPEGRLTLTDDGLAVAPEPTYSEAATRTTLDEADGVLVQELADEIDDGRLVDRTAALLDAAGVEVGCSSPIRPTTATTDLGEDHDAPERSSRGDESRG